MKRRKESNVKRYATRSQISIPKSAVSELQPLISLVILIISSLVITQNRIASAELALVIIIILISLPLLIINEKAPKVLFDRIDWNKFSVPRVLIKLYALYILLVLLLIAYSIFPEYKSSRYEGVFDHLLIVLVTAAVISPAYVIITDLKMGDPYDGLYTLGRVLLFDLEADREIARRYFLGWIVKAFFLPLMFAFALGDLRWLIQLDISTALSEPRSWFTLSYRYLYLIDVVWASLGYLCTLRLFDCHIRSVEPTLRGWVVCIVCYPPFWGLIYDNYLKYEDGYYWGNYFPVGGLGSAIWGGMILSLTIVYVWATISFGVRFSNLTNRGIITSGPYRFTKHPAYISKNIAWWLISMPFIVNSDVYESIKACALLLIVNGIYYLRAKTEEVHLSADPVYSQYAQWMSHNGLFARIRRGARSLWPAPIG